MACGWLDCHSLTVSFTLGIFAAGDMWPNHDNEDEPDWVATEREQFGSFRDKDKDGKMDQEEVRQWIIPDDYDHVQAEMRHLFFESDVDRVGGDILLCLHLLVSVDEQELQFIPNACCKCYVNKVTLGLWCSI